MSVVDEIKDRLPIEDLVSQYVTLKKVGRSLKGLCPFHNEKTPSFIVSPERGIAYCFGCNRGGDIFKFMQEVENVDFPDALKILAERTGVKLDSYKFEKPQSADQKDQMYNIHEKAARFYEQNLWKTADGEKVLDYLRGRGLGDESIRMFRVGFSPDSFDQTNTMLQKEGFTKKSLVAAGIALTQETTVDKIYDRFRGRLMFPIFDSLGRVIGFGGRALKKEQDPKYLNSPDTAIYHKSQVLYGFSHGKQAIKEKGTVVLVEGYMDLIAVHQSGVKNAVATSGTALTAKQLRILKPFVSNLILAFDMDLAGQEAAQRAYELSQEYEYTVKVALLPSGKDPAEYAKSNSAGLAEIFEKSFTYGEYLYKKLMQAYGTEDLASKRKIIHEFMPFMGGLKSSIEKDGFIRDLARDMDLKESQIYDEIRNFKLPMFHPARGRGALSDEPVKQKKYTAEELIIGFMIDFPRVASIIRNKLDENLFSETFKPIYKAFCDQYNDHRVEAGNFVITHLPDELQESAKVLSLYVNERYGEVSEEVVEKELISLVGNLRGHLIDAKTKEIQKMIKESERTRDKALTTKLLSELSNIRSYGTN
jgi:DNA primase